LWGNGIQALQSVGVMDPLVAEGAQQLFAWEIYDRRRHLVWRRDADPCDPFYSPPRQILHALLHRAARDAGVEVLTSSSVQSASPDGRIITEDGATRKADLVVGADGIRSNVRNSLSLTERVTDFRVGSIRVLVPRMPDELDDTAREYWNRARTLLYTPVSPELIYLCLTCPIGDSSGREVPVNKATWKDYYPHLSHVIDRISTEGRWDVLSEVAIKSWSAGHVAIVGDAASAMPPTLGQAANTGMANAIALADFVTGASDIPSALRHWERARRGITDHTSRWSAIYNRISHLVPPRLDPVKTPVVAGLLRLPLVQANINRASRSRWSPTYSPAATSTSVDQGTAGRPAVSQGRIG
jgi:2-polyprenyl-6-methoxyphenol hydroxylase-like FAD-dependent oxidoreductase